MKASGSSGWFSFRSMSFRGLPTWSNIVADQVGLSGLGILQRAPDRLGERAHRHVVGASGRPEIGNVGHLALGPCGQRLVALCRNARDSADDGWRIERADIEIRRRLGTRALVRELARPDIGVGFRQMRHDLMIIAAKLNEPLYARPPGEGGETGDALDLHDPPEFVGVSVLGDVPDIVARGKEDGVEGREISLGEGAFRIISDQQRKARHPGGRGGRLARGERHVIPLGFQEGRGIAADHPGAADDDYLQVRLPFAISGHCPAGRAGPHRPD